MFEGAPAGLPTASRVMQSPLLLAPTKTSEQQICCCRRPHKQPYGCCDRLTDVTTQRIGRGATLTAPAKPECPTAPPRHSWLDTPHAAIMYRNGSLTRTCQTTGNMRRGRPLSAPGRNAQRQNRSMCPACTYALIRAQSRPVMTGTWHMAHMGSGSKQAGLQLPRSCPTPIGP